MPNINFGETIQGRYVPIDLKGIDTALVRAQERFDKNNVEMANQIGIAANTEYIDPIAREQAMQRFETRYSDLAKKYNGNLQNATPEVLRSVYTNLSDPWFNVNKHQVNQAQLEEKAATVYGADAIKLSDVRNQKLVDPTTGQIRSTQDPSLMANVLKAADYQQIANQLTHLMKPDQRAKLLKRFKGDPSIEGFLTTGSFGGLSEEKILEITNDPALSEVFKSMASTYQVDNRANVGYDPKDGSNMFTRELSAEDKKRFKTPIAKYLYGVSKQMKNYTESNEYMQDPIEMARRKRASDEEEMKKLYAPSLTEEAAIYQFQGVSQDYTPSWDKNGNISGTAYPINGAYAFNPQRMLDDVKAGKVKGTTSDVTAKEKELRQTIQNYRTNFGLEGKSEREIYDLMQSKPFSVAYQGLTFDPKTATDMKTMLLTANSKKAKVAVGNSEYMTLEEAASKMDTNVEDLIAKIELRSYTGLGADPQKGNMNDVGASVSGAYTNGDNTFDIKIKSNDVETQTLYRNPNAMLNAVRMAKAQKTGSTINGAELVAYPFRDVNGEISSVLMPINGNSVFIQGQAVPVNDISKKLSSLNLTKDKVASYLRANGIPEVVDMDEALLKAHYDQFYSPKFLGSPMRGKKTLPDSQAGDALLEQE